MYKKIILAFLLTVVCSISYVNEAFAFIYYSPDDPYGYLDPPVYRDSQDDYYIGINSTKINKYRIVDTRNNTEVHGNTSATYFTGVSIGCTGKYRVYFYDDNTSLASMYLEIYSSDLESSSCSWEPEEPEEPTNPPTEPEEPTNPPTEPEEPTNPPTEPEKPDYCEEEGYDVNCEPIDPGEPGDGGWDYDPDTDCMYYPDLPRCQEDKGDPPPEDNEDPYDRDGNGINDYLEQDWDDPKTVIPYCDQLIPGSNETFGEHPSVPCLEKDLDYENLPECDPEFIDWEPCREPGNLPWEEPYPEFDYPEEEPEECAICSVFECPGWDEYMGFLEDLADDIVGEINVPEVPEVPELDVPIGQEDPGLEDASFNADDIKNNAGEIQFREDPTGGFNITNPLESIPEDGSTAPRPSLEVIPNPGAEKENGEVEISPPIPGGGEVKPPNPGGTVTPPTADGTAKYPGVP